MPTRASLASNLRARSSALEAISVFLELTSAMRDPSRRSNDHGPRLTSMRPVLTFLGAGSPANWCGQLPG